MKAGNRRLSQTLLRLGLHGILAVYAVIVIYPLFWVAIASFKTSTEISQNPWGMPGELRWSNYVTAWQGDPAGGDVGLASAFLNSVMVTTISLAFILLIGAMAAYVLARFVFTGSGILYNVFLFGMMFPVFLGIIPLYLLLNSVGLLNTFPGLILVYVAYSLSFTIFIMTGFFKTLPGELAEAGAIDGCSHFGVFWKIMLPLARPGLITAGIFNAFGLWNEYPLALVLLTDTQKMTLPLAIASMAQKQHYQTDWGALFAGLVIVLVPTLVGYIFYQRRITEGLTAGAVKG